MGIWTANNECALCHDKCKNATEKKTHEESYRHLKKVSVDKYFKEYGDGSKTVETPSNLFRRYRISGDRHLGLDWIHELHLPFSNDSYWACSICNEAGSSYEECDVHLLSLEHIRNHVLENGIENEVKLDDDQYTAYEKLLRLRNEIISKDNEEDAPPSKPEVVNIEIYKKAICEKLALPEEPPSKYETKKLPDMPKFAILQCEVCYQLTPVTAGKKVIVNQVYENHECIDDHRRYNLMKGVINQFSPEDIEDEELKSSPKPYCWQEGKSGAYYGPVTGTMYLIATDTEQFCTLCCCIVGKVEEHFTSEKHIAAYLSLEHPVEMYRLCQLSAGTRRGHMLRLLSTTDLHNGKCMQIKCPRLPTLLKLLALPEVHHLPVQMPELVPHISSGDFMLECRQCATQLKVPSTDMEGGVRIWNSHIESEMHMATAVTCSKRRFLDRFYVPAISNFKLESTELHGKWEKQFMGKGTNATEIYTQTQCDVGLDWVIDDLEKEEITCALCSRTFKKSSQESIAVINRHLRSFMHVYRYFYFTNPQLCSIITEQESDGASQEFLLDCLRREPQRSNHLIKVYSPDLCLELDDLPKLPYEMVEPPSRAVDSEENETEKKEEERETEDEKPKKMIMTPLRQALQALNIRIIDIVRDQKRQIERMLCRCLDCGLAFMPHVKQLKEDIYDNHINTAEHIRRKAERQNNMFAPNEFLDEYSGHTVKPYPQKTEKTHEKIVWLPNGQYVLSVVGLEEVIEKRVEVGGSADNPIGIKDEIDDEENEVEPTEKIVNFYCRCCCLTFPLKSFHLENHIRSYEHIANYVNVHFPHAILEFEQVRAIFRGVNEKKGEDEARKAIVSYVKEIKPWATYCIAIHDPAGVLEIRRRNARKKAQQRVKEIAVEEERKKANEDRIRRDRERQELKAQIAEEKIKKMVEAAEQKKKIDDRLKAIKMQQELEIEKRKAEAAKREEQEKRLQELNKIIDDSILKKSKVTRQADPEAEAKRNMAHFRMHDIKKQLEEKKGVHLKESREAIDEPKLVIPAKLSESLKAKNEEKAKNAAAQNRLQAELEAQQRQISGVPPPISVSAAPSMPLSLPNTSLPPPPVGQLASATPSTYQPPIWGMPSVQPQQPAISMPPPPTILPPTGVVQQPQLGGINFVSTAPQPPLMHPNPFGPGLIPMPPHNLMPPAYGMGQPAFNVPPPGYGPPGMQQMHPMPAPTIMSSVPPPVLPPVSTVSTEVLEATKKELKFDPKPVFSNYVPRIERIPQFPTKGDDGEMMAMSESDNDSARSVSPSPPKRDERENEPKVPGRPEMPLEVMWPVKRYSLSKRAPDPQIMTLKNRSELEKMLLKYGFEKTPTQELPAHFNRRALKTKGAVGIEHLYEIVCVDLPELDTMFCMECREWNTFPKMLEHLASEEHQLTYLLKNHRYLHDQVTREDNAAMKRVTLQQFCQTIQEQTRQEMVSQRFRTLVDKEVIAKFCPEFIENISYEWLGFATPNVDRIELFGRRSQSSRKRSRSRSPTRGTGSSTWKRRRSRSRSPDRGYRRRSRTRSRSRSRSRERRSRSPRRSYRRRSRSRSRSRERSSRKEKEAGKKKLATAATLTTSTPPKFPPTGLGQLGEGRWDMATNRWIPNATNTPNNESLAPPGTTPSPKKTFDPFAQFAASIANLRNFANQPLPPAAGATATAQSSVTSFGQALNAQSPAQESTRQKESEKPSYEEQQQSRQALNKQMEASMREKMGLPASTSMANSRDPRNKDKSSAARRENRDRDYRESRESTQSQLPSGGNSLADSIAAVQKKVAEEKSVRLRKLLGLTVAIEQEKTKGQMITSSRLMQMFHEFGVAPTTIGVATVDDLMRFLNDELRSLQDTKPTSATAATPTPTNVTASIDLQQFGIMPSTSKSTPQFPAPYNSQGIYQQIPMASSSSQLYTGSISIPSAGGSYQFSNTQQQMGSGYQTSAQSMGGGTSTGGYQSSIQQQMRDNSTGGYQFGTQQVGGQGYGQTQPQQQQSIYQQQGRQGQYQQYQQPQPQQQQQQQSYQQQASSSSAGYSVSMQQSSSYQQPTQRLQHTGQVHIPSALAVPEKPKSPILKPNPYMFTRTEDVYGTQGYSSIAFPGKNDSGQPDKDLDEWDDLEGFITGRN